MADLPPILRCPYNDTRFPPPNTPWPQILVLRTPDAPAPLYLYQLILSNSCPEADAWLAEATELARQARAAMPADTNSLMAIIQALHSRKMLPISHGPRGTVYLVGEGEEGLVGCVMERGEVGVPFGGRRVRFRVLGWGVKACKGDWLVLGEEMGAGEQ